MRLIPFLAISELVIFATFAMRPALKSTAVASAQQAQSAVTPSPAQSRANEMLDRWNDIGNKLVAMAQDFPEDKYDFKVQKDERTFALNLLHAAALDFILIRRISGSNFAPTSARATILRANSSRPRPTL